MSNGMKVTPIAGYRAVRIEWGETVNFDDERAAFGKLKTILDKSDKPIFVHVALDSSSALSMSSTVMNALKVFRHQQLQAWIVTGATDIARNVGGVLMSLTGRKNIIWLDTDEEVEDYLREHAANPL